MKLLTLLTFIFILELNINAQSVHFEFNNGNNNDYFIPYLRKITFDTNNLNLAFHNGSINSMNLDSVLLFNFNSSSTSSLDDELYDFEKLTLFLFPNPSIGQLNIRTNVNFNSNLNLVICNLSGVKLIEKEVGIDDLKSNVFTMEICDLPSGFYLFSLTSHNTGTLTKPFLKQ